MTIVFPSLPDGFRFGVMSAHCESWEAYDSLAPGDGWVERKLKVGEHDTIYKTLGPWPSAYIAVHPPRHSRPPELVRVGDRDVMARLATVPPVTPEEDEAWAGWTAEANDA